MTADLAESLVPNVALCPQGVGLNGPSVETVNGQDAAPRCANTGGPLTPPEPVRTSELP